MSRDVKKPKFESERELAAAVASWGEAVGWDVYKEVSIPDGGTCDLVFVQGKVVWIIETKLSLSEDVLMQATSRASYAHHVSVAVPEMRELAPSKEFYLIEHGIGLLQVTHPDLCRRQIKRIAVSGGGHHWTERASPDVNWLYAVSTTLEPTVRRHSDHRFCHRYRNPLPNRTVMAQRIAAMRRFLSPEHKTLIAGGRGNQLTPWRMAKLRVVRILAEHAPLSTVEIYDRLGPDHPWQNRRSAIAAIGRMLGEICRREFTCVDGKWSLAAPPPAV